MVGRHSKIDDEESMDAYDEYQSSCAQEHGCVIAYGGMTDALDEQHRVLQHFQHSDRSCIPLHDMIASGHNIGKMIIVAAACKGDVKVERDIVTRLHLFPGEPGAQTKTSATSKPILDDWELVGAGGLKDFNRRVGGKGTINYSIGWDKDFVEAAQQFIPDYATLKREKRKNDRDSRMKRWQPQ